MEEVMGLMKENSEGMMEFPRDITMQDCFSDLEEPLYGFVTNVTLVEDMPCILGVQCFENGTTIRQNDIIEDTLRNNLNSSNLDLETQQRMLLNRVCGAEEEPQNRRTGKFTLPMLRKYDIIFSYLYGCFYLIS